jgi:hypothetical protein
MLTQSDSEYDYLPLFQSIFHFHNLSYTL